MSRPARGSGVEAGVMPARWVVAGAHGAWLQAPSGGGPFHRSYPPPVYRREEDVYVIGQHADHGRRFRG